jgi:uncharacterized protein with von Willebrand factor type A (vWA) domain
MKLVIRQEGFRTQPLASTKQDHRAAGAGMSYYANHHRREAIKARQQAAQTIDPDAKRILEDIARSWEVLAEHTEWLEHKLVSSSARGESHSVQQQQQVQPKDGRKI